ncbi:MAG: phosphoenolpyruvate synthase [Bdellovibrio sp.]|nr:phosphoenolpyruvate synthase [Bdellovibrio sp.]
MNSTLLTSSDSIEKLVRFGGGKATNLARLSQAGFPVPRWFCVSSQAFNYFVELNSLKEFLSQKRENLKEFALQVEERFLKAELPEDLEQIIAHKLAESGLDQGFVAVRSSGLDEDSAQNSFAGQFSSFLFQKGKEQISQSLKKCWASGFSERALSYRIERGIPLEGIQVGVVIQKMVNAEVAGVVFSRNPIHPTDRSTLMISSVWGQGEGLVSGELDADHFEVQRKSFESKVTVVPKSHLLVQSPTGGLLKQELSEDKKAVSSLTRDQVTEIAKLSLELEKSLGSPQDAEWAIENSKIYLVQTRPITHLPCDAFFDAKINGDFGILWDNSNIIESYSGVTSPLTFSFASGAYRQVYIQFCELVGVPKDVVASHEPMFRNMLGLIRGRIYYNLINWYKLVLLLPGSSSNKGFMETMMGVKQKLKPEMARIFDEVASPPEYSFFKKLSVNTMTLWRFIRIDSIVGGFQDHFRKLYEGYRKLDFRKMSLNELSGIFQELDEKVLRQWKAPIINDYLCMVFFGLLKKLTENWIEKGDSAASLQNDLLCGQGELESTEPTKMLMRIAEKIDLGRGDFRDWISTTKSDEIWSAFRNQAGPAKLSPEIVSLFYEFLDKYGFRCINELKLEETDLHDDPSFALSAISSYVRMKSYSISSMEEREKEIKKKAEDTVRTKLSGVRLWAYMWILKQARKAVKNRENLRFARTKIFGVARHLFRGMGHALTELGHLDQPKDVFFLTVEELQAFVEGRAISVHLKPIIAARKAEYEEYRQTLDPPDRLITIGAACATFVYPQILADSDLLRNETPLSTDPNVLVGTPCCPGVIEGTVRVVENIQDADGMSGEILVTARTDPGWVPLYPSCSGLLIERGSLLSHSAVVARELGLPTIVGISGGLMTKLKTGQKVRIDAAKGEVRILA